MLCKKLRLLANGLPFSTADVTNLANFEEEHEMEEPKQQPEKEEQSHIES